MNNGSDTFQSSFRYAESKRWKSAANASKIKSLIQHFTSDVSIPLNILFREDYYKRLYYFATFRWNLVRSNFLKKNISRMSSYNYLTVIFGYK